MSELGPIRMRDRGPEPHRRVRIERWSPDGREARDDLVAAEEPLQIASTASAAVVMRTPGHDLELVLGLLYVEGLIRAREDVAEGAVAASGLPEDAAPFPVGLCRGGEPGRTPPRPARAPGTIVCWRRNLVASSACGICGAAALDALRDDLPTLPPGPTFTPAAIAAMAPALRDAQATFELTGGLHAAGLFDTEGRLLHVREDVGRHNAVDKLVGGALLAGELPLHERAMMVSGRASFELPTRRSRLGSADGCGLGAVKPGGPRGAHLRPDAGRLPARRPLQHLCRR
jgi:FdhD protein